MTSEPEQAPEGDQSRQKAQAEPADSGPATPPPPSPGQILEIRKYPNRRLYDATRSQHVTLDELYELVAAGHTVRVRDSKTGEDLTNQILLQALIERDPLKVNAVPTLMIHLMIRMNAQLIASCFGLGLNQMFDAYRAAAAMPGATGAASAPWWPAGWPVPGMNQPGAWGGGGPGASGQSAGAPWLNPFAQQSSAQGGGFPASPLEWLQTFMGAVPGAGAVTGEQEAPPAPAPAPKQPAAPEAPPGPVEDAEPADLDTLRKQVAALALELKRLKSSPEAGEGGG